MASERGQVFDLVDGVADACTKVIADACDANPNLKANAIIMTSIDVLTASIIVSLVHRGMSRMSVGEIIEAHTEHVIAIAAGMEKEHNRGQQS